MSRPTVYKYLGTKDEAFVKVVQSRLERALAAAQEVAYAPGTPVDKVLGVLAVKLEVAIQLWRDSPGYAYELLSATSVQTPELISTYVKGLTNLVTSALAEVVPATAREVAGVLLTFTRGLEDDLRDVEAARQQLKAGVHLITLGALDSASPPA